MLLSMGSQRVGHDLAKQVCILLYMYTHTHTHTYIYIFIFFIHIIQTDLLRPLRQYASELFLREGGEAFMPSWSSIAPSC